MQVKTKTMHDDLEQNEFDMMVSAKLHAHVRLGTDKTLGHGHVCVITRDSQPRASCVLFPSGDGRCVGWRPYRPDCVLA